MTWRRVVLAIFLSLVAVVAAALWWGLPRIEGWALRQAETGLSQATKQPVSIEGLSLHLVPISASLQSFTIGAKPAPALQVSDIEVHVQAIDSLRKLHLVLSLQVGSVSFDATRWPAGESGPARKKEKKPASILPLPPVVIAPIEIGAVHVVVPPDAEPVQIDAPGVSASVEAGPTQLQVGLQTHDVQVQHGGRKVNVSQVDLNGGENRHGLMLQRLVLQSDLGSVQASPKSSQVVGVQAQLSLDRLGAFLDPKLDLRGELALSGTVQGSLEQPRVEATIDVDNPGYDAYDAEHLQVVASLPSLQKLDVSKVVIRAKGMEVDGQGDLCSHSPMPSTQRSRRRGWTWRRSVSCSVLRISPAAAPPPPSSPASCLRCRYRGTSLRI